METVKRQQLIIVIKEEDQVKVHKNNLNMKSKNMVNLEKDPLNQVIKICLKKEVIKATSNMKMKLNNNKYQQRRLKIMILITLAEKLLLLHKT